MRPLHQREGHSLATQACGEDAVGHFDGFEGAFAGREWLT
jgi:hypothetical protein